MMQDVMKKIIVVDDDPDVLESVSLLLGKEASINKGSNIVRI
ncbi:MAG TPA: hypothetical protein ACFYEC_07155 [Candidatus Brocadiaceae bacterium]